ncbi:hypothetical protein MC885_016836 [Smutsia gigantea]|nr:hypothetical protein MC885_016836 [Smutsia gigantea]
MGSPEGNLEEFEKGFTEEYQERKVENKDQEEKKLIAYQREFLALKERLRIAEHRISQRSSELNAIVQQFRHVGAETNGSKDALNKFSVSIVMGIPTVKREVKSYLIETLHSLIDNLYPEEKLDCVIVVFIGELQSKNTNPLSVG